MEEQIGFAHLAWLVARNGTLAVCTVLGVLGTSVSVDAKGKYITINLGDHRNTLATSINDHGVITGYYQCAGSAAISSFVRATDGTITTFDVFSCTGDAERGAIAESINNNGVIAGTILNGLYNTGFVREANGIIKSFECISDQTNYIYTKPVSINDKGVATGVCVTGTGLYQGFVRASNGKLTIFDPAGSTGTYPCGINNGGAITGYYTDTQGTLHGFLRSADGTITSFDPSGSNETRAVAIDNKGVITGYYNDKDELDRGFVRAADGVIKSFRAFSSSQTTPMSINSQGAVAGSYTSGTFHGFVRSPDGTIRSFDQPRSALTYPVAINSKGAITGYYDRGGNTYGFLRTEHD